MRIPYEVIIPIKARVDGMMDLPLYPANDYNIYKLKQMIWEELGINMNWIILCFNNGKQIDSDKSILKDLGFKENSIVRVKLDRSRKGIYTAKDMEINKDKILKPKKVPQEWMDDVMYNGPIMSIDNDIGGIDDGPHAKDDPDSIDYDGNTDDDVVDSENFDTIDANNFGNNKENNNNNLKNKLNINKNLNIDDTNNINNINIPNKDKLDAFKDSVKKALDDIDANGNNIKNSLDNRVPPPILIEGNP